MNSIIIGIDIGTSGCKTILVNEEGKVLDSQIENYPLYSPKHGWFEQNPEDWWNAVKISILKIIKRNRKLVDNFKSMGLSGQMHGLVALDRDLNVIRPCILWNDQRTEAQCKCIYDKTGGIEELLKYTNNKMLPGYTAGKIIWLHDNEPENYKKVFKILNPKDFIRFKLTGEIATEVSDASGTGLFDVKNRNWSDKLLNILSIPLEWLPKCYESPEISGYLKPNVAEELGLPKNLPVAGGGGDSVIQTLGTGIISSNVLMTTIGTAGIISTALETFRENPEGKLQIFCNVIPHSWHAMGVTLAAGGSLRWIRDTLAKEETDVSNLLNKDPYEIISSIAETSSPGSNGLIFLPYLSGERCPYTDPHARGAFIGLSTTTKKSDIYRSVMEGVIFSFRDVTELFDQIGMKYNYIATSGGGAQSNLWRQIHSDIFQKRVITVSGSRGGAAYGAAIVAGVGIGLWKNFNEAISLLKTETINDPVKERLKLYDELYKIYKKFYPLLKESFSEISRIEELFLIDK